MRVAAEATLPWGEAGFRDRGLGATIKLSVTLKSFARLSLTKGAMQMKSLGLLLADCALTVVLASAAAHAQSSASFGAGPNGYDYMVGTWSCVNGMAPTAMGAPAQQMVTVSKTNGAIFFHNTS